MSDFAQIRFQPNRPLLRELSADRLNTILQEIRRNKPKGERGITVRQDGTGTYIGLAASLPRGTTTTRKPIDIIVIGKEDTTYTLKVVPGIVSGILPENWDDEFEINSEGLCYGKAICTTDGRYITSVALAIDATPPTAQQPQLFAVQETVELLFGLFQGGSSYNVTDGKLSPTAKIAMTSPNTTGGPLDPPLEAYYVLI